MINLDTVGDFRNVDKAGMIDRISELPGQFADAWRLSQTITFPPEYSKVDSVLVLGMGGSAIGADLVRSLVVNEIKVPLHVIRDYDLPAFAGPNSLVIASSYSGGTEETISAFNQALAIGCKTMAITTGGRIKDACQRAGIPVLVFSYAAQPRAALGYSFTLILGVLHKLGLLGNKEADLTETARIMSEMAKVLEPDSPIARNPAKQLAQKLHGRLPVIYGGGLMSEVARRWKGQVNENAKAWSFFEVMPELNHNASVGYEFPAEISDKITVIFLDSPSLHPRVRLRYKVTQDILAKRGVAYEVIDARGNSSIAQMMSNLYFGDYVSYYLSMLYQVDPSPVEIINYLKAELERAAV